MEAERGASVNVDLLQLVSCTYKLLRQQRSDMRIREEVEDQYVLTDQLICRDD